MLCFLLIHWSSSSIEGELQSFVVRQAAETLPALYLLLEAASNNEVLCAQAGKTAPVLWHFPASCPA